MSQILTVITGKLKLLILQKGKCLWISKANDVNIVISLKILLNQNGIYKRGKEDCESNET